jgi:hypothetical protein
VAWPNAIIAMGEKIVDLTLARRNLEPVCFTQPSEFALHMAASVCRCAGRRRGLISVAQRVNQTRQFNQI